MRQGHGNVKVGAKFLILRDSDNLKIRNPNIEIRNNIKIRISNDRNIPGSYAISIWASNSFEFGILVIRICFGPPWRDMIATYYCQRNISTSGPVEIWPHKSGLGQGFRISSLEFNMSKNYNNIAMITNSQFLHNIFPGSWPRSEKPLKYSVRSSLSVHLL